MQKSTRSFQLYFDELIHAHLLQEEVSDPLYDRAFLHDADIAGSEYTCNTSAWD